MAQSHSNVYGGRPHSNRRSGAQDLRLREDASSQEDVSGSLKAVMGRCAGFSDGRDGRGFQGTRTGLGSEAAQSTLNVNEKNEAPTCPPSMPLAEVLSHYGLPSSSSSPDAHDSGEAVVAPTLSRAPRPRVRDERNPGPSNRREIFVARGVLRFSSPQHALEELNRLVDGGRK
eukprot:TRINITY_DN21886_c0_g3_i1.p1 TRINITY_DN21886_c0_g3~~TRINITY_DN21886_c0_g3_i1.p1  ORF type:complete len:173 (+),score=20.69 TRINITY_DN21886_c0_g3_i1:23-541(+)